MGIGPAVDLQGVALRLKGARGKPKDVVHPTDLQLQPGTVTALLGPNGAGKTSLLRMIAGLLTPTSGQIRVCGYRLPEEVTLARTRVGFLSPGMRLYDALTPRESLLFFGKLHGHRGDRLQALLSALGETFELTGFWDRRFQTLSSGEKQRSLIALLRLHDPDVLVLDEVTASLDLMASQHVLDYVRAEKARGKCVILSTHLLTEAESICDEILVMAEGRILIRGTPEAVKGQHQAQDLSRVILNVLGKPGGRVA